MDRSGPDRNGMERRGRSGLERTGGERRGRKGMEWTGMERIGGPGVKARPQFKGKFTMIEEKYTTTEVINICGLHFGVLKEWIQRGFISPSIQVARSTRDGHLFSRLDIYRVAVFSFLVNSGVSREIAKNIILSIVNINKYLLVKKNQKGKIILTILCNKSDLSFSLSDDIGLLIINIKKLIDIRKLGGL